MFKDQSLTNEEWAIICTINQEPKYRFLKEELTMAKKMEARGLLQFIGNKMFSVTKRGQEIYKRGVTNG